MARDSSASSNLLAVAALLIVAVGALAVLRFDLGGVRSMLMPPEDDQARALPAKNPGLGDPGQRPPVAHGSTFDLTPPTDEAFRVTRESPLPDRLTISRRVGNYKADLELVLVPQGWFMMGENDGVASNQPKRWVWCSDFYIARTEMTNEQYFAFILANGYRNSSFWSTGGLDHIRLYGKEGTGLIGWGAIDEDRRLWELASPDSQVTFEVRRTDGLPSSKGLPLLVLPHGGDWENYLSYDAMTRQLRLRVRDNWQDIDGATAASLPAVQQSGHLHFTDDDGRVHLPTLPDARRLTIITWPDGPRERPTSGVVASGAATKLRGPRMPVVHVSWYEAEACANFWGGQLPFECWWEKAARGTDGRLFPWGDDLELSLGEAGRQTTPRANFNRMMLDEVGSFPGGASPYGMEDAVGNVAEWVRDAYQTAALADRRYGGPDPHFDGEPGSIRSERGARSADDDAHVARVYSRRRSNPDVSIESLGFRIAFTAEAALKAAGR